MTTGVLLALTGDDAALVRVLDAPGSGFTVVRRCADLAELLSAGMAGLGAIAVLDTDLDDVDRTVVDRLHRAGLACLLLCDENDEARWASMGLRVLPRSTPPEQVFGAVQVLVRSAGQAPACEQAADAVVTPTARPAPPPPGDVVAPDDSGAQVHERPRADDGWPTAGLAADAGVRTPSDREGRIVAVWGPMGAPGRTTVAASLAHGLSHAGPVLLVDADLEAPSLVQVLGLAEDSSALASAARLASHGRLDDDALDHLVIPVHSNLGLLSGLGRAGRWRELPPVSMAEVWQAARRRGGWTVVDLAAGLEPEQVDDFALEPGRHAVACGLLEQADVVVLVGGADPVGVRRLVQLLGDLSDLVTLTGRLEVVVNRVRASAAGPAPERAVREAVARFGRVEDVALVPEDVATVDRCVLEGRAVLEGAPTTAVGRALAALADRVDGGAGAVAVTRGRGRLARLWPGRRRPSPLLGEDDGAVRGGSTPPAGPGDVSDVVSRATTHQGAGCPAPAPPDQDGETARARRAGRHRR